jgi:uncharacterized repeat protein (TIGR01451 family)
LAGDVVVTVPATGWSAPRPAALTLDRGTCSKTRLTGVTGQGPWDITVDVVCPPARTFSMTWSDVGAPTRAGRETFAAAASAAPDAPLVPLTPSPVVRILADRASSFTVGAPATTTAGDVFGVDLAAWDRYGNLADSYRGSVALSSDDGAAVLPARTAFADADAGRTRVEGVSLRTAGSRTLTATDVADATVAGSSPVQVEPGALHKLELSPATSQVVAGSRQAYTAHGFDAYGNSRGDETVATTFTIEPDGSCSGAVCTATTAGPHTVTGTQGAVSDAATLEVVPGETAYLRLDPERVTVGVDESQAFTAHGSDSYGNSTGDVTGATTFSISPSGSCSGASCAAAEAGQHTVTGTLGNAIGTAQLFAVSAADLAVQLTAGPDPVLTGQSVTYQFSITNSGPQPAAGTAFGGVLPEGTDNPSFSGLTGVSGCTYTFSTRRLQCDAGTVAPSGTATASITLRHTTAGTKTATATTTVLRLT